jgi:hypothetical protein
VKHHQLCATDAKRRPSKIHHHGNPLRQAEYWAQKDKKWVGCAATNCVCILANCTSPASGNCVAASRTFNSRECKSKQHAQECDDESPDLGELRAGERWMDGWRCTVKRDAAAAAGDENSSLAASRCRLFKCARRCSRRIN